MVLESFGSLEEFGPKGGLSRVDYSWLQKFLRQFTKKREVESKHRMQQWFSTTPLLPSVPLLFSFGERKKKKLWEIKVYFQHQLQNALKALTKGIALFKSKKTPNDASPTRHKETMVGKDLSFQRSLNALLMPQGRKGLKQEKNTDGIPTLDLGNILESQSRAGKWRPLMASWWPLTEIITKICLYIRNANYALMLKLVCSTELGCYKDIN